MNAVQTNLLAENRYWLSGAPKQEFYLYLELQGREAPVAASRVPLNLSLVIDRSGSMAGEKVAYAKKAAQFVVENLLPSDRVSVVQYDTVVDVVSPSSPVHNKAELVRRIEQITARSSTNLSGGMQEGYQQAANTKGEGFVNRVLLLSDGLANVGITDPAILQQIAQDKFRQDGIALSTFGVGVDFDEVLMTNLSEYGGGNYYFIESPDKIPSIFAEELHGLLSVVAQNVHMEVRLPSAYFRCEKVYGFPADITDDHVHIRFNDLFSLEKKAVLLKMVVVKAPEEHFAFQVDLRYDNALGEYRVVKDNTYMEVAVTGNADAVLQGVQKPVLEQTTLFVASDLYEQAVRLAERGEYDGARQLVGQIKTYIEKHFQNMPPNEELKKLYETILQYEQQLAGYEGMDHFQRAYVDKLNRMQSYSLKRKKPF